MNRAQLALSILAVLVVISLTAGAVGTAIVDGLTSPDRDDDPIALDENTEDAYEQDLRNQVEDDPNDAATLSLLANYLAQTGRLTEAITWYEKALALEPDNWPVRLDFARSLADGGKRTDAEFQFKKIIEGQPDDEQAHYYLAELYRNWVPERIPEAVAEYRRTIDVGAGTYVAELAAQALAELGYATPRPVASPAAATAEATA
jgi:cytochrome c-type biogenesis protein CcmH/NrfG